MDSGSQRITFFELLLVKPRKLLIFAPLNGKIPCGCGVIGSRARLRIWCREACRFESYHPHTHTVFYRQKPTKTAILVGFLLLIPRHYEKNRHRFGDLFGIYKQNKQQGHPSQTAIVYDKRFYIFSFPTGISSIHLINTVRLSILTVIQLLLLSKPNLCY